jgi:hypothetical protein
MKKLLWFLVLFPLSMVSSCGQQSVTVTANNSKTININLNISALPEKHLKLYMAEGKAIDGYEKIGPNTYKPKRVEYYGRRYVGITPLEKTFTFHSTGSGEVGWEPAQYALYYIQPNSSENSLAIAPWGFYWEDPNTKEQITKFYDLKQFPFDYFQTHPNTRNFTLNTQLILTVRE